MGRRKKESSEEISEQIGFTFIEGPPEFTAETIVEEESKEYPLVQPLTNKEEASGLIDHFFLSSPEHKYSQLILFYDSLPRFIRYRPERKDGKYLPIVVNNCEFAGSQFEIEVKPVRMREEINGEVIERDHYPSNREEIVEDALRKLAADGRGKLLKDQDTGALSLMVEFTLYEIQQMLRASNKTLSTNEIKEAIRILRYAPITIKGTMKELGIEREVLTTTLSEVYLTTRSDRGEDSLCRVVFNQIITKAILKGDIRLFNYLTSMSFATPLARYLYKRLVGKFTFASAGRYYTIHMSTIYRESGEKTWKDMSKTINRLNEACDELLRKEVIENYECEYIFDKRRKNKILDAKYMFVPSKKFCSEMVYFHRRQNLKQPASALIKKLEDQGGGSV